MDKKPVVLESSVVFQGFFNVRKDRLLYPNQHVSDYYVVTAKKQSVAIVATNMKGELLITREYRHPVNQLVYGCPGGYLEPEETYIDAAKRELLEETGYKAIEYHMLAEIYPLPGILDQKMAIVHAKEVVKVQEPNHDAQELLTSDFMHIDALREAIRSGATCDGILCSALFFI